jgi:phytoene dehydrogenase-like protein
VSGHPDGASASIVRWCVMVVAVFCKHQRGGGQREAVLPNSATSSPVRPAGPGDLAAHTALTTEATRMIDDGMARLVSTLRPNWPAAKFVGRSQHELDLSSRTRAKCGIGPARHNDVYAREGEAP